MDDPFKFEQLVQFRAPANLSAAIEQAAKKKCQSKSDYLRQSVMSQLQADGITLAQPSSDAGSLYDRLNDGRSRYALIVGDDIAGMSYHDTKPEDGRTWLPVAHVDSEPFDILKHWRLAPTYSIDIGHVVCTYPVVVKSLEFA